MMISYQTLATATGGLDNDLLSPVMHYDLSKGGHYVLLFHSDLSFIT